jgi:hypothetical protein
VTLNRDVELHSLLIRYLFDEVSDEERDQLEERLLADAEFHERLAVAEEEIADRYVKGELVPEQRTLVERKFEGCPEWEARTDVARAMARIEKEMHCKNVERRVEQSWAARSWEWRFVLPVFGLLTVAVAVWFVLGQGQRHPVGSSQKTLPNAIASFLLTPAARKDGGPRPENIVELPSRPGPIELRLPLDRDFYSAYRVELQSFSSGQTVSLGVFAPSRQDQSKEIRVSVESATLSPGRYTIVLQASETDGSTTDVAGYSFRVTVN